MRVTEGLLVQNFLAYSSDSLSRMADAQTRIATGKRILRPSDEPQGLAKLLKLKANLREVEAYTDNASAATAFMSLTETALAEASNYLTRAKELVLSGLNGTSGGTDLEAQVLEVRSMIDSMLLVANRDYGGRFLFGGQQTRTRPYETIVQEVIYRGDSADILEQLGPGLRIPVNLTGPDAFETVPARIHGQVDLDPAVSTITPLADLLGGDGIATGIIRVTDSNGVSADIDLMSAETIGNVIDGINNAGLAVTAAISADGTTIELTDSGGGTSFSVEDLSGGDLASDLGIETTDTGTIRGTDLNPAVTENTPMALVLRGTGIGAGTWRLSNARDGEEHETIIDPTQANTVGDLLNLIENATDANGTNLAIEARIEGTDLVFESRRLHTILSLTDVGGGTSAVDLGVSAVEDAKDVFELLAETADALERQDYDAMNRSLQEITAAIDQTAGVRGTFGARSRQVLAVSENLRAETVDLTTRLADIEDADLAKAAIELTQAETVYNASLAAGARLLQLNLFNYIR